MGLVAILSLTDTTQIWHLAAVSFVTGMGMAFYYPAYSAWLPSLVPESDLMAVNGFEGMVRPTIGQAIGPAVAGVVVGAVSPGAAITVAAARRAGRLVRADRGARRHRYAGRSTPRHRRAPGHVRAPRHARGLRLHGPHPVAAGHAAVRRDHDPGDDGPARGPGAVPDQGPPRRWPRRPRARAGCLRHRRRRRLAGDGVDEDAAPLPHLDEPALGRRLPAVHRDGPGHRGLAWWSPPPSCSASASRRRWSSGARCSSAGCRRTCSAASPRSTSSSRSA